MTDKHKANLLKALSPSEMGPVAATKTMKRLRPDGELDAVTIEIGVPRQIDVPYGDSPTRWVCTMRISLVPRILAAAGSSSLDAIINATYLAAGVLPKLPFASEIDMSLLPYFGLPINPITTTPEQLDSEQKRHKEIKIDMNAIEAVVRFKEKSE